MSQSDVPAGADAGTRDAAGRRSGGEQLHHADHLNMPLIWFTMAVIVAGFIVGGVAVVVGSVALFVVGLAVVVVGGVASLAAGVMRATE